MDEDEDLIPTKDVGYPRDMGQESVAVLQQQRMVVAKIDRGELEDRYLRLLEENVVLKKHACKQEDKIKKLATKLIRVISDKKRMEMSAGGPGRTRDIETEELIEDQQQQIRELEHHNNGLKEKLLVARNQLVGNNRHATHANNRRSPGRRMPQSSRAPSATGFPSQASPSPVPLAMAPPPLISQQAQQLLEEARNENRMLEETVTTLKEQVNIYEQEVDQIKEQTRIKENNFEDEISILKNQVAQSQRNTVTENIEIIRLQRDNKHRAAELESFKAQVQGLEENMQKMKVEMTTATRESEDLIRQLQEEQRRTSSLTQEISASSSSRQALYQAQEKMRDLQKENSILRESNEKLLNSAFDLERERQFQSSENALKVQIAQLETTLKSDLNDKKNLTDALYKERESYGKLELDFQDIQSKYFAMKENMESQEEKIEYFARQNTVDIKDLEEALLFLKQKKELPKEAPSISFIDKLDTDDQDMKTELSELQVQHVDAINELDKTRNLLRIQNNINNEQKKEISALQKRFSQMKMEYQEQISEYQKLLGIRASKIQKLESMLRESAVENLQKLWNNSSSEKGPMMGKETSVHIASGQTLFEIHIQRISLNQDALLHLGLTEPRVFLSWLFYDSDQSYTPVIAGPVANFDSSSYYKVVLDESFLEFLHDSDVIIQAHVAIDNDCQLIAASTVKFSEVLEYPQNKLHASVILSGVKGSSKDHEMGGLDFWFRLHTHDTKKIKTWMEQKKRMEKLANVSNRIEKEVLFLQGEKNKFQQRKSLEKEEELLRVEMENMAPSQPDETIKNKIQKEQQSTIKTEKSDDLETKNKVNGKQRLPNAKTDKKTAIHEPEDKPEERVQDEKVDKKAKFKARSLTRQDTFTKDDDVKEKKPIKSEEEVGNKTWDHHPDVTPEAAARIDKIIENRGKVSKKKSILKKMTASMTKSIQSTTENESSIEIKDEPDNKPEETIKPEVPKPMPRNVMSAKDKRVVMASKGSSKMTPEEDLDDSVSNNANNQKSTQEIDSETEDSEEDSEEETEDDSEEEDSDDDDEDDSEEDTSEYDTTTATESTAKPSTHSSTNSSSSKGQKFLVSPEVHRVAEATTSESQDSEGVVIKKSPARKASSPSPDNVVIVVSDFEAAKGTKFSSDENIQQLYVEYKFLDLPQEELETPFALPKPEGGEKITFNFRKVIAIDRIENSSRRRLLTKMLKAEEEEARQLRFTVVSEPPEEDPELDCEDIGVASVDLGILVRSGKDLEDQELDVFPISGEKEAIGTLTISIEAATAFQSLNL